jgi:hypothetical protein
MKRKKKRKERKNKKNWVPGNKSIFRPHTKYVGCYAVVWMCLTSQKLN